MRYHILQTFNGSQDGTQTERFEAGTERELSDYLAGCVDPAWVRPVKEVSVDNKAIVTEGPRRGRPPKADKA